MYPSLQSTKLMLGLHSARKWGLNSPRYVFPTRVNKRLTSAPNKNTDVILYNLKRGENWSLSGIPGFLSLNLVTDILNCDFSTLNKRLTILHLSMTFWQVDIPLYLIHGVHHWDLEKTIPSQTKGYIFVPHPWAEKAKPMRPILPRLIPVWIKLSSFDGMLVHCKVTSQH